MVSRQLEDFEPDIYEEFSNPEDEKTLPSHSKYLEILDDHYSSTKSDKKVMFADDSDNEYEPIDRMVGDDSAPLIILSGLPCGRCL